MHPIAMLGIFSIHDKRAAGDGALSSNDAMKEVLLAHEVLVLAHRVPGERARRRRRRWAGQTSALVKQELPQSTGSKPLTLLRGEPLSEASSV